MLIVIGDTVQASEMVKRLRGMDMPVFTTRDAASLTGKAPSYMKVFLAQLVRRKVIEKVERGRYCLVGTSPYVIASRITKGSYVALISAARFHNITTQLPNTILVFSPTYHRPMVIKDNYRVRFIKVDRKILYGYNEYNGAYVADIEKVFLDDMYYHRSLTYTEELETAVARRMIDMKRLGAYIKRLGAGRAAARLRQSLEALSVSV